MLAQRLRDSWIDRPGRRPKVLYACRRLLAFIHLIVSIASLSAAQTAPPAARAACQEWHECQRLALEAYSSADYERFHDLAWRTMQTGPARNPDLMLMLARAQSLSGRPHDALVMLGRLADMGAVVDVLDDADFRAVRQLRQWPDLEARMTAAARPPAGSPPSEPAASSAPAATVPEPIPALAPALPAPVVRHADEALRIPGASFGSAGFAYDRVSSRFVVADLARQKLMIIDERSRHVVDLVTSASAGFYEITGFEIDADRGDLWVVSAAPENAAGGSTASALHKLQLVSGRPIERVQIPDDLQPCRLADVAVRDGRILLLDTLGNRLLRFHPATHRFVVVAALQLDSPSSIAPAGERTVYVAHRSGIARVDTVTGAVEPMASARSVPLDGFERLRWAQGSLVGIQRLADGAHRAVRIKVVEGRAASIDIIDSGVSAAEAPASTVSGDDFYFLVREPGNDAGAVVIRRSRLR